MQKKTRSHSTGSCAIWEFEFRIMPSAAQLVAPSSQPCVAECPGSSRPFSLEIVETSKVFLYPCQTRQTTFHQTSLECPAPSVASRHRKTNGTWGSLVHEQTFRASRRRARCGRSQPARCSSEAIPSSLQCGPDSVSLLPLILLTCHRLSCRSPFL